MQFTCGMCAHGLAMHWGGEHVIAQVLQLQFGVGLLLLLTSSQPSVCVCVFKALDSSRGLGTTSTHLHGHV